MKHHVQIDEVLKELSVSEAKAHDFEPVEEASAAIIQACEEIEKCVKPRHSCHCC